MKLINQLIKPEIGYTLGAIFGLISACLAIFYSKKTNQPNESIIELFLRTRSWAFIAGGLATIVLLPPYVGTVMIAYLSFLGFREMASITGFRSADRTALLAAYGAIPVQYYLAYHQQLDLFFAFIPIGMFTLIPFILISGGKTKAIGRSMALIPSLLMLTVFMISHIGLLFNLPISDFDLGYGGLILYLLLLTALNDVFQYTWGKLLGKRKIIPAISPNKTWAGFLGGIITTGFCACLLRFLTPLSGEQALVMGWSLGLAGFAGDILISAIKRDLDLKDTDDIIPGHGGIMDRMDSLVLTAPVFYYLLTFFMEQPISIFDRLLIAFL